MDSVGELTVRQGTVYRNKESGQRLLLINHNPMNLESMALLDAGGSGFDVSKPGLVSIDSLIAMRTSGQFEELGDLPAAELKPLLEDLLRRKNLPETEWKLVRAVCDALS